MADAKRVGTKVEPTEVTDPKKVGEGKKEAAEVEGQELRVAYVWCPWCDARNRIIEDTERYLWFRCWNCRNYFKY